MHQVQIAGRVLREEHDGGMAGACLAAWRHRRAILKIESDLHAGDGLHALVGELIGKLQGAEEIVRIGDRQRRHRIRGRKLGELGDVHAPFAQRIGAVNMKMHEAGTPGNRGGIYAVIGVRARHHRCFRLAQAAIYPRSPG